MMYKKVDQSVILYGSESWALMGEMIKVLERLHQQAARRSTGMTVKYGSGGEWQYPPVVAALEAAGIHPIMEYIRRWQATILEKVACRTIYQLCVKAERMPGTSRSTGWWNQDVVNEPEEYTDNLCNLT